MIKFFRHIRIQLLGEGKTGKYFKYAIGEILLVVIGILIALQINTWNENRLEKTKSKEYHERIIEDLDFMIMTMEGEIKRSTEVKTYITAALHILQNKALNNNNKDTLDFALKNYYQFVLIDGRLNSIEEMKSSGQLGLIYNKDLKRSIDGYLSYLNAVSKIYQQISRVINEDNVIEKHLFIKTVDNNLNNKVIYDFNVISNDQTFINKLSTIAVSWQTKKSFSEKALRNSKQLKQQIQEELEK
jgi:hypothetical protein